MTRRHRFENWIILSAVLTLLAPATTSGAQRTFVSAGSGSDANPCTRALPCRQFAAAIVPTDPGGEVVVLDSGGYGTVTVNDSVSLVAPAGVHAAITAFSGNAITISAGVTDVVVVRGLYLTGLGGTDGISFLSGQTLHVENCVASGFAGRGVFGNAPGADVYIKDTVARDGSEGFRFESPGAPIRASLDAIRAEENATVGVAAYPNSVVTVTRSVGAGNGNGSNFYANGTGVINLESCTAAFAFYGVFTVSGGTARVANSMITGNSTGVFTLTGGTTISFGNNRVHGNNTNGTFTSTISLQ